MNSWLHIAERIEAGKCVPSLLAGLLEQADDGALWRLIVRITEALLLPSPSTGKPKFAAFF